MDRADIAEELRRTRERAGLTQAEIARRAGTTQSAVSRMESGRVLPSVAAVVRFAEAVGTSITLVLGPAHAPTSAVDGTAAGRRALVEPRSAPRPGSGRPLPSALRGRRG